MAEYGRYGRSSTERSLDALKLYRGFQGVMAAEAEQENTALRGMLLRRELAGPSEAQKFQFEQQKFVEQQRHENVKFALTTFNQLSKESSPATKAVLMEHMGRLWGSMNPAEQASAKMIYDHSPLNPIEQKATWWDSTMQAPKVTAEAAKDPYAYGVQLFNQDDYFQQRQNFIAGTPIQRRRIISVSPDTFAVRDEAGKVSILTSADMALRQVADEHNTTPGALLADNGFVYSPEREVMVGGVLSKVRNKFDAIRKQPAGVEVTPTSGAIGALAKDQQDIQDFLASWAGKDVAGKTQGSRVYKSAQTMLDAGVGSAEVMSWVKSVYPGWNFKVEKPGKQTLRSRIPVIGGWFDAYAEGDEERLVAWPGSAMEVKASDGKFVIYHDPRTGKVYDPGGKIISNGLDELTNYVSGKTMAQIKGEAKGK